LAINNFPKLLARTINWLRKPRVLMVLVAGVILCAAFGFRPVQNVADWGGDPGQVQGMYLAFGWVPDPFRQPTGDHQEAICNGMLLGWYEESPGSLLFKVRRGGTGGCDGGGQINLVSLALNIVLWCLLVWNIVQVGSWLLRRARKQPIHLPHSRTLLVLAVAWAVVFIPANFYMPRWEYGGDDTYALGAYLPHKLATYPACDVESPPDYNFTAGGFPFRYREPANECADRRWKVVDGAITNYRSVTNPSALALNAVFWLVLVCDWAYLVESLRRREEVVYG
jgi:hypothetical protein